MDTDKKPLTGQFRFGVDGKITDVPSKASDRPVKESQASLLQWGEDREKLERWAKPLQ